MIALEVVGVLESGSETGTRLLSIERNSEMSQQFCPYQQGEGTSCRCDEWCPRFHVWTPWRAGGFLDVPLSEIGRYGDMGALVILTCDPSRCLILIPPAKNGGIK